MDKYDEQIEFLTQHPDRITDEWELAEGLFKMVGSGCLTMIRAHHYVSVVIKGRENIPLTKQIRVDSRIPADVADITPEHLPAFAEWQRKIDVLQEA